MELPDLEYLNQIWYLCQNQNPVKDGYCSIINDNGMIVPFFADDLNQWRELWLALQFKEALWEKDYEIYDEDDLEETRKKLSKLDYNTFIPGPYLPIDNSISIEFEGTVSEWEDEIGDAQEEADRLRENMS